MHAGRVGRTVQGGLARGPEGVAVISRDLTRTYSGRCMEWDWTGLGDRAIESLRRIHLLIFNRLSITVLEGMAD